MTDYIQFEVAANLKSVGCPLSILGKLRYSIWRPKCPPARKNMFHLTFRDSLIVGCINSGTSIYAGFCTFSVLGFMAKGLGKKVGDVVQSGTVFFINIC